jgi:beta-1,4-N-acetylglucosaminyltransferase
VILVTVGMHTDGFLRLVQAMDHIAAQIDEEVVMQIGNTPYEPRWTRWFTFASQQEIENLCQRARVIVCHAGAGSILTAMRYKRPLVVMPRRKRFGEVVDDHQLELAEALSRANLLQVAYQPAELLEKVGTVTCVVPPVVDRTPLIQALRRLVLTM